MFNNATLLAILEGMIEDTTGILDGAVCGLWTGDLVPDEDTVMADVTLAVFSGYAPSAALVWADPYLDFNGNVPSLTAPVPLFRSTAASPFVGATVNGLVVYVPGTPNVLRWIERFESPVYIDQADRIVDVTLVIPGTAVVHG